MAAKLLVEPVIELITKIFGKNALSKTIGTRTNVITLPDADVKRIIKNELDIAKASDAQLEVFRKRAEQLIPDIPKMNDQELLTFKGNLQRYYDKMYPPSAEVFDFETKRKFSPKGIEQLETEVGMPPDVDVKSPLGRMLQESKFNLKDVGKIFDDILGGPKKTTEELYEQTRKSIEEPTEAEKAFRAQEKTRIGQVFDDLTKSQKSFRKIEDEGLVRATVRQILDRDRKSGKIKLSKDEDEIITFQNQGDPIDIFRKYYGEDALEQVDSLVPQFRELRTQQEAADLVESKFTLEPQTDRPPGSYDPDKPPEFADGGRVKKSLGGAVRKLSDQIRNNQELSGIITSNPEFKNALGYSPIGAFLRPVLEESTPKLSEVNQFANQYIENTTGKFIDENKNGIDDRLEKFADGGRVHASMGLVKGMIDWLVKNRNFAKELLDKVSKQKNGEKLIKELYEAETKKTGTAPMTMGEAPKTNLPKVRAQKKADEEGVKQLAQDKQIPVKDETIVPEDVMTVPEPFKGKYQQEFLAHDALYGRRSGDNKVDAEAIAETVADMQGKVYDDLGYTERMDLYDKAYGYLSLLDRTTGAMKEAKGRTLQANGGVAYLMGL